MSQTLPPRRLSVEQLEDRLTPSFGTAWFDGSSLTLSFVPDGTDITGKPSNLSALLTTGGVTQPQWQLEILRAYQTWAVAANLNIGLVTDGGQAMGVAGAPQEDVRFGDIRIGARPLSAPGTAGSTMANAVGFDYDSKTWAGDLVFNSLYKFGIGGDPTVQSDIFSVALHEAGHSFGLADQNTDRTSVLYNSYQGVLLGLSSTDVAALRALYGARPDDRFEGTTGNGTLATATALGNITSLDADITRIGDADVYKFTTPAVGTAGLTVNLQAAGISLLTGKVTVYDAQGNAIASAVTTDPMHNNLSVTIPNYHSSTTYSVKVEGADTSVFSVGSYVLQLKYTGANTGTNAISAHFTNLRTNVESFLGSNSTIATATTLAPASAIKANTFILAGAISSPTDVDFYKITPTMPGGGTGTLFVGTMTTSNGLLPSVTVYNAAGQLLSATVTLNEGGSYEIQLAGAVSGTAYFIRVSAANAGSGYSSGFYTLGATLAPVAPTTFTTVTAEPVAVSETVQYSTMTISGDRLTQFTLFATGGSTTAATAVRLSIFDATGHLVFTLATVAGRPLATGAVWLAAGNYSVVFNAATQNGSAIGAVSTVLSARTLSDPIDPYLENPTAPPPPPLAPILVLQPVPLPTLPPAPIVDPIVNPFLGMIGFPLLP